MIKFVEETVDPNLKTLLVIQDILGDIAAEFQTLASAFIRKSMSEVLCNEMETTPGTIADEANKSVNAIDELLKKLKNVLKLYKFSQVSLYDNGKYQEELGYCRGDIVRIQGALNAIWESDNPTNRHTKISGKDNFEIIKDKLVLFMGITNDSINEINIRINAFNKTYKPRSLENLVKLNPPKV